MTIADQKQVRAAYREVVEACGLENATRSKPWAAAGDSFLLNRVLDEIDSEDGRILDLGCCGYP